MRKIIKLTKELIKKNYFLSIPNKVDVLIFGNTLQSFNFKKKKFFILHNQIFILILLKSFFKSILQGRLNLKNINDLYFFEIIKVISPKVAIGNEINFNIFKFKKFFPKKVAIGYQCVQWSEISKARFKEWYSMRPLICDYFFVFDKESKKTLNFIKSKFIISGSVRNNEIITTKRKKKYDIMFISEFRDKSGLVKKTQSKLIKLIARESLTFQGFIIKVLGKLVKEKKLRVCVSLASSRPEKSDTISYLNEKKFLNNNISKFYTEPISSYELAEKSRMIITFTSTIGKELLAKKKKVMFVLYSKYKSINQRYLPNKNGKYWYKGKQEDLLKKKILQLLQLKEIEWVSYLKKNNLGYEYDKGNSKLKNLIIKLLNKN